VTAWDKVAAVAGVLLHLVIGAVPFAVSGLVAPLWGVVVLFVWWLALAATIVRLLLGADRRPRLAPLVPVVALAGWFAFVSFGGAVLGWTA
jgi:hypothetical protein